MKSIKSGLRAGTRVRQGDVIGFVGTTGRSTGPHLHYEILINGQQVNPRGVNVPTGTILEGRDLNRFKANKSALDQKFAALTRSEKYAQADTEQTIQ
jgi:murein DD-endopeptidase MepM/ murein hydrolase activator NlpD